jgi:NADPH-dependent 2,4-dienoyl-CoA reductase/sulfur reductase-like enzyme
MPPYDPEMVQPMQELLKAKGVRLMLGDSVKAFSSAAEVCLILPS